jgi:hypothetical protein
MQSKDYYQILQILPSASPQEVKKAFRQLALLYHPDRNNNDALATDRFKEIKEAYEVLSNIKKRQAYHYKKFASSYQHKIITPASILYQCIELRKFISIIQHYNIDYDLLSFQIKEILSAQNIAILEEEPDEVLNKKMMQLIIEICEPLPYHYFVPIAPLLISFANDTQKEKVIHNILTYKKRVHFFEKNKLFLAILITAILCLIIYYAV